MEEHRRDHLWQVILSVCVFKGQLLTKLKSIKGDEYRFSLIESLVKVWGSSVQAFTL